MRIQFEFKFSRLPISYRLGMLSIIKEMVGQGSNNYYNKIFIEGSKKMKPFSFSPYIKSIEIDNYEIKGERLFLTISSPDYEFIMHLMNGSQRNTSYHYQRYELELVNKHLLPKPSEFSTRVIFKTLSPLLIEDRKGNPLLAEGENFEQEFNYYANLVISEFYNRNLYQPIHIEFSSMKKFVIKENLHQNQSSPIFITANHGLLGLKGHPEDFSALYELGVGRRRSLGLGLLSVEEVIYSS